MKNYVNGEGRVPVGDSVFVLGKAETCRKYASVFSEI